MSKIIKFCVLLFISFTTNSFCQEFNYDLEKNREKTSIIGLYILKSCENGRFKIVISKKEKQYFYTIFDKKKTITKGKAIVTNNKEYISIMLGLIGGIFSDKNIQIQNYGNAMNEFIHFTQCDEKYLTFEKKS